MSVEHLIAFNLTLLAALASPGPALLIALRTTLSSGRAAGIATGAGLAVMASAWTGAALVGLAGLFAIVPWAYVVLKTAGAIYLMWIAWKTWRSAYEPVPKVARPQRQAFLAGIAVNLANPKSVLFAAAVLLVIFPPDLALWEKGAIVLNHLVVELIAYTAFATLLGSRAFADRYLAAKHIFDRIAASVLGLLGLRLLLDRTD